MIQRVRDSIPPLNPNDSMMVLNTFQMITSPDNEVRMQSEKKIRQLEIRTGYLTILWNIINNKKLSGDARVFTSIMIKQYVERYWSPLKKLYPISNEERKHIILRIFEIVNIENQKVLFYVCSAIGEMLGNSHVNEWFQFYKKITVVLEQCEGKFQSERSVLQLFYSISKRIVRIRSKKQAFQKLAETIINNVLKYWDKYINLVLSDLSKLSSVLQSGNENTILPNPKESTLQNVQTARVCTKHMLVLLQNGVEDFRQNRNIGVFFNMFLSRMKSIFQFQMAVVKRFSKNKTRLVENTFFIQTKRLLTTSIKLPMRVHGSFRMVKKLDVEDNVENAMARKEGFLPHLAKYLQFACQTLMDVPRELFRDYYSFLLKVILFISKSISGLELEMKRPEEDQVVRSVFTNTVLLQLVRLIISKYFVLSKREILMWNTSPERFYLLSQDDTDTSMRGQAETLYTSILENFSDIISPVIVLLQQVIKETNGKMDFASLQMRDSAYTAMGWGNFYFRDSLNFSQLYFSLLKPELMQKDPRYKITQKRILWVCGRWCERHAPQLRLDVYQVIKMFLSREDLVMKMSALSSVSAILEGGIFEAQRFARFSDAFVSETLNLVGVMKEQDTKLKLFDFLWKIVTKLGPGVLKYTELFVNECAKAYTKAMNKCEFMLMDAIVKLFTEIVQILSKTTRNGKQINLLSNKKFFAFLVHLIEIGINVKNRCFLHVHDEAVLLWKLVIQNLDNLPPVLLSLYPNVVGIMDRDAESYRTCLKISESYLLLGNKAFLTQASNILSQIFDRTVGKTKDSTLLSVVQLMDISLSLAHNATVNAFSKHLSILLKVIIERQTKSTFIVSHVLCLFSRILFKSQNLFLKFFGGNQHNVTNFLDFWIRTHDHMISPYHRKVSVLSLLSIYPSTNQAILNRFKLVVNLCVKTLYEKDVCEKFLYGRKQSVNPANEVQRRKYVFQYDEFLKIDVFNFMMNKFKQIKQVSGEKIYNLMMGSVDNAVMEQFKKYASMRK